MCYCEPSADYDTVYRTSCQDERAETTKCTTREAIPTLYAGVLHGQKICGERGGQSFKKAKRLEDNGRGYLVCPAGTKPCDDSIWPKEEDLKEATNSEEVNNDDGEEVNNEEGDNAANNRLLETDGEEVQEEEQEQGEEDKEEDGGIEAVEIEEEKCTECISKETVLADPEHPANFVMCTDQLDQCPITGISLKFSEEKQNLEIGFSRKASNLPLLKFKIS